MTGAFEQGDGKIFWISCEDGREEFYLYLLWLMTGAFEGGEGEYFCVSCEDGEDGIFFLYLLRVIRASSRKEKDNFFVSPAKTVKENFFLLRDSFCLIIKGTIVVY